VPPSNWTPIFHVELDVEPTSNWTPIFDVELDTHLSRSGRDWTGAIGQPSHPSARLPRVDVDNVLLDNVLLMDTHVRRPHGDVLTDVLIGRPSLDTHVPILCCPLRTESAPPPRSASDFDVAKHPLQHFGESAVRLNRAALVPINPDDSIACKYYLNGASTSGEGRRFGWATAAGSPPGASCRSARARRPASHFNGLQYILYFVASMLKRVPGGSDRRTPGCPGSSHGLQYILYS
jgi:hypothetical protein